MTGDVVIRAEGLGKKYVIGHEAERERYTALRDVIARNMKRLARSATDLVRGRAMVAGDEIEEFWALKDIDFEIKRGEVVGVIGHNGAGKSTLLKILSRVTEPSQGRVEIKGRFASLLEVGTGFHLELTGRENIFLNGAVLGMRREEIKRKLDEIVNFSGVEQFLDTPTKRYSSGMLVRLGFAVAAHLEPEILIIDEVLAVGDAEFQKKCLGKMNDVSKGGRTILFVSHNMGIVGSLCPRVIWIDHGKIRGIGPASKMIGQYMTAGLGDGENGTVRFTDDPAKPFQLTLAQTVDQSGATCEAFSCDDPVVLECKYFVRETVPGLYGYMSITRSDGVEVLVSDSFDAQQNPLEHLKPGSGSLRISIPPRTLAPGEYLVLLNFTSHRSKVGFNVDSPGIVARFRLNDYTTRRGNGRSGYFSTQMKWSVILDKETAQVTHTR
jgi:lipopolysaccharide transport system ATP-binding protein